MACNSMNVLSLRRHSGRLVMRQANPYTSRRRCAAWQPAPPNAASSSPYSSPPALLTLSTLAAAPIARCTRPESASTPTWAFKPKYYWLPSSDSFIFGLRSPLACLV